MSKKQQQLTATPKDQEVKTLQAPVPEEIYNEDFMKQHAELVAANPPPPEPPAKDARDYFRISREAEGWLTEAETQALWNAGMSAGGPSPLWAEVGSFKGKSTAILAGVLAIHKDGVLFAIDPHEGDLSFPSHFADSGLLDTNRLDHVGSTLEAFMETINKAELGEYVILKKMKSTEFALPEPQLGLELGLLFLDGLHDYESVKADWEHFKPMLKDGATVIFHDYKEWEGVTQLVHEITLAGEVMGFIYADSLAVTHYFKP